MKILLLSHGKFADGIKESFEMIMGTNENVLSVCLDEDGIGKFEASVTAKLNEIINDNKVIILTDLKGGTPYNAALKYKLEYSENISLITGMNLPMLLEIGMELSSCNDIIELSKIGIDSGKLGISLTDDDSVDIDDNYDDLDF